MVKAEMENPQGSRMCYPRGEESMSSSLRIRVTDNI